MRQRAALAGFGDTHIAEGDVMWPQNPRRSFTAPHRRPFFDVAKPFDPLRVPTAPSGAFSSLPLFFRFGTLRNFFIPATGRRAEARQPPL